MKSIQYTVKSLILIFLFFFGHSKFIIGQDIKIQKVKENTDIPNSGIVYALPKSVIVVEIDVEKTITTPPKEPEKWANLIYEPDSLKEFMENNPVKYNDLINKPCGIDVYTKKNEFKLKNFRISFLAKPDLDQVYIVNPKKKWNKNKNISFTLSELGLIQGSTISVEDKTFNIIVDGIQTVASIVSLGVASTRSDNNNPCRQVQQLISKKEILIGSGTYGSDLKTLQFQLSELDKLISKKLEIIQGKKVVKKTTIRFEIELTDDQINNLQNQQTEEIPLATFHKNEGLKLQFENDHILYPSDFLSAGSDTNDSTIHLILKKPESRNLNDLVCNMPSNDSAEHGLAYRIPEFFVATVRDHSKQNKLKTLIPISQAGTIIYLPTKMNKSEIAYYEQLGSLKLASTESSAINSSNIKEGIESIINIKDSFDEKSDLEKLTEEVSELELRVRKKAAENALND